MIKVNKCAQTISVCNYAKNTTDRYYIQPRTCTSNNYT